MGYIANHRFNVFQKKRIVLIEVFEIETKHIKSEHCLGTKIDPMKLIESSQHAMKRWDMNEKKILILQIVIHKKKREFHLRGFLNEK